MKDYFDRFFMALANDALTSPRLISSRAIGYSAVQCKASPGARDGDNDIGGSHSTASV